MQPPSHDWMCEPAVINGGTFKGQRFVGTHLSVLEHQRRTVENFLDLRDLAPDLPFFPVLQGWEMSDYLRCAELYEAAGIDLTTEPLVGLGSVCRRQGTSEITAITWTLMQQGFRLHGFGVKTDGLAMYADYLVQSDSLAWSFAGRYKPGCAPGHESEANCMRYALAWRQQLLRRQHDGSLWVA